MSRTLRYSFALLLCLILCVCFQPAAFANEDEVDFTALENEIATAQGGMYVEGTVRIERDLVIPQGVTLNCSNGTVIVPEGVTVTVNGVFEPYAIELNGKIINNREVYISGDLTLPADDINRHIIINPGSYLIVNSKRWTDRLFDLDFSAGQLMKKIQVYSSQELLSELGSVPELDNYLAYVQVCDSFTVPFGNTVTVPANCRLEIRNGRGELTLSAGVDMRIYGELRLYGASFTASGALINNGTIHLEDYNKQRPHLTANNLSGEGVIRVPARGSREENLSVLDIPGSEGLHSVREGNFVLLYNGAGENIYDELSAMIAEGRQEINFLGRGNLTLPESGSITIPAGTVCTFNYLTAAFTADHLHHSSFLYIPEGFNLIVEGELNLGGNGGFAGQITAQNGGRVNIPGVFNWSETGHILVNNAFSNYDVTYINALPDEVYIIEGDSQVNITGWRIGSYEQLNAAMDYVSPDERIAINAVISSDITVDSDLTLSGISKVIVPENVTLTVKGSFRPKELEVQQGGSLVLDGGNLVLGGLLTVDGNLTLVNTWVNVPIASYESLQAAHDAGRITYNGNSGFCLKSDSYNADELADAIESARTIFVGLGNRATPILNVYFDWTVGPEEDYTDLYANVKGVVRGVNIVMKPKAGTSQGSTLTVKGKLKAKELEINPGCHVKVDGGWLDTRYIYFGGSFETNTWVRVEFVSADNISDALRNEKITFIGADAGFTFHRAFTTPAYISEVLTEEKSILDRFGTERTQALAEISCDAVITEDMDFDLGEGRIEIFSGRPNIPNSLTVQGKLKAKELLVNANANLFVDGGELIVEDLTVEDGGNVFIRNNGSITYMAGSDMEALRNAIANPAVSSFTIIGNPVTLTENLTIPADFTVIVAPGSSLVIPAGVAVTLRGHLILRDGATLDILQTSGAYRGEIIEGTLEVDEGATVNLDGKLKIDKLRLDGTLTTQNSGTWWAIDLIGLVNGRPKGHMIITNAGQHDVNVNGLDETKLNNWVSFEGDDASLRLDYYAQSDADFRSMSERIANLPARFLGRLVLKYDAVIRGNVVFPGAEITVTKSLTLAEGAVLNAPIIHSKGAEITVSGTFISRNPKYDHNRALMLNGLGSKLTITETGIIGGDDCTIEFSNDIPDPGACLDGIQFEKLRYCHDPIREAAGFLTYRLDPDLTLPAALNTIESEAFAGGGFNSVYIPAGVTSIAPDAFGGKIGLKVYGEYGSQAETFAAEKGFPFAQLNWSNYPMYNSQ